MDWNNDGKLDLISGDTKGQVWLFLNTGTPEKPELAKGVLVQADGKPIAANSSKLAETYSKLHMADWDGDGLKDLLIGGMARIVLYKNIGTPSEPKFGAPVNLTPAGGKFPDRSSPFVVDWDGDGKKDLLVGTESGQVLFYRNTGTDKKPKLAKGVELPLKAEGLKGSYRWRLDVTDWNDDGKLDLLVGNFYSGGKEMGGNIWLFLGK